MRRFYRQARRQATLAAFALLFIAAWPLLAGAAHKIALLALFKDKAILQIDGARRVLASGETSPEGVTLVKANTEEATIEIAGRREVLELGVVHGSFTSSEQPSVTLWADPNGFFHAEGSINSVAVRFLVDTGANTIALNSATAQRIGIDYKKGQPGVATTASGYTRVYGVTLNTVKIGGIVLHNVAAGVIEGPQPAVPLLGMSFLGSLEMRRDGQRMDLTKRY